MKIPIKDITINERQRIDLGDLQDLASMGELGQLNAIGLFKTNGKWTLVDGRRRLAMAVKLGWTEIEAVDRGNLAPLQAQEIELVEDIGRKDRNWVEKCLAVAKLYGMKKRARQEIGENWSQRMMASFTNEPLSNINVMLRVAEAVKANPDSALSKASTYTEAAKELFVLHRAEVEAEMERRRQGVAAPVTVPPVDLEDTGEDAVDSVIENHVEQETVYLHGTNKAFEDCVPGVDFMLGGAYCVMGFEVPWKALPNIAAILRPEGFAVLWVDSSFRELANAVDNANLDLEYMPWPLIWDTIAGGTGEWPFVKNYYAGMVLRPKSCSLSPQQRLGSVISHPFDVEIPFGVVDFVLSACCPPNMAACFINHAPVKSSVELGHIPIWFEADPKVYEEKCEELTQYYQVTIPNVEVKRP